MDLLGFGSYGKVFKVQKNNKIYSAKVCRVGNIYEKAMQKEIRIYKMLKGKKIAPDYIDDYTI